MGVRRILATAPVAGLLLALGAVASPASACACGGIAPPAGADVAVGEERAIVSWDGERERIELVLDLASTAGEAGLLLPTPTPAEVTTGSADDLAAIEDAIAPREVIAYDWWGAAGAGGAEAGATPPEVLARVQLGPVEATTLAASDAAGLDDWLDANGYAIPEAVAALLPDYVERGWSFVALRLTADVLDGALDPLVVTFDSDELVYPMALSQAATTAQTVRLYVFDDHRMRVAPLDDPSSAIAVAQTAWAGPAPGSLPDRGSYLTVVDLVFSDPATQIPGDLVLVGAGDDSTLQPSYTVTRPVALLGIPLGVFVVLGGLALVPIVAALVVLARRRRART